MKVITKTAYFLGIVFLLTGMLLSAVNLPVQAAKQSVVVVPNIGFSEGGSGCTITLTATNNSGSDQSITAYVEDSSGAVVAGTSETIELKKNGAQSSNTFSFTATTDGSYKWVVTNYYSGTLHALSSCSTGGSTPSSPIVDCIVKDSSNVIYGAKIDGVKYYSVTNNVVTLGNGSSVTLTGNETICNGNFTGSSITVTGTGSCTAITATATNCSTCGAQQWGANYTVTLPDGAQTTYSYGPLASGASFTASITPTLPGTYTIQFQQEAGHPGDTENGRKYQYTLTAQDLQQCQPPVPAPLTIAGTCKLNTTFNGYLIDWSVINPNNQTLDYTYNSLSYSVAANSTALITSAAYDGTGTPSLTINWTWLSSNNSTSASGGLSNTCPNIPEPNTLLVSANSCATNQDGILTYTYTYAASSGTIDFYTSNGTKYTATNSPQTLTSSSASIDLYDGPGAGAKVLAHAEAGNMVCAYRPLIITGGKCGGNYGAYTTIWNITNPDHINYFWSTSGGKSGGPTNSTSITAPFSITDFNSNESLTLTWSDATGSHSTTSSAPVNSSTCEIPNLTLTSMCFSYDQAGSPQNSWRVENSNAFAVDFTWEISGTGNTGAGTISANAVDLFWAPRVDGTMIIKVMGTQVASGTANSVSCGNSLALSGGSCTLTSTGMQVNWTVENPNAFPLTFAWAADNTVGNGSSTVGYGTGSNTKTFQVPYSGTGSQTISVVYDGLVTSQTITPSCPSVSVIAVTENKTCEIDATTLNATFTINASNIGENNAYLLITDPQGTTLEPITIKDITAPVTVAGNWPGVGDGTNAINITWTYQVFINGIGQGTQSISASYDPKNRETCQLPDPKDLLLLDPYCNLTDGVYTMAWEIQNPNPWTIYFSWVMDGDRHIGGQIPGNTTLPLTNTALGSHTLDVHWYGKIGDAEAAANENVVESNKGGKASLTYNILTCEQPQPTKTPVDPTPTEVEPVVQQVIIPVTGQQAPQATLAAPQQEGTLLIPVTGADLSSNQLGGSFFTNLYTQFGMFFFGIALILSGIQKKFIH